MTHDDEMRAPKVGMPVLVYVVSLLASIYLVRAFHPATAVAVLIFAVPAAALVWMVVQARRAKRFMGGAPCGSRAYQRRIVVLALSYIALLLLAVWLNKSYALSGPVAVVVALLPALPLVGMIVAMARLIIETQDEYQRMLHVRQMLIATGFTLAVCSVWGFLEEFGLVMHVPAYWTFVLWCGGLAIGTIYNETRA
jgi:hypothetical protein